MNYKTQKYVQHNECYDPQKYIIRPSSTISSAARDGVETKPPPLEKQHGSMNRFNEPYFSLDAFSVWPTTLQIDQGQGRCQKALFGLHPLQRDWETALDMAVVLAPESSQLITSSNRLSAFDLVPMPIWWPLYTWACLVLCNCPQKYSVYASYMSTFNTVQSIRDYVAVIHVHVLYLSVTNRYYWKD